MKRLSYCLVILVFSIILAAGCKRTVREEDAGVGEHELGECLVMPGHAGKEEFSVTYQDKDYYFCCAWCVEQFNQNPEKYLQGEKHSEDDHHGHEN